MSLNIEEFEKDLHLLIVERGKEYYEAGNVESIEQTRDGWMSQISGQESYTVILSGHEQISQWHCTCPFEHGPICKHVVATLYAVRKHIRINRSAAELDQMIEKMDPESLRQFVKSMIRKNDKVKQELFSRLHPDS